MLAVVLAWVRGAKVSYSRIIGSFRHIVSVLAATIIIRALDLFGRFVMDLSVGDSHPWLPIVIAAGDLFIAARTVLVLPRLVDADDRTSVTQALSWSWKATRGHTAMILLLIAVPVVVEGLILAVLFGLQDVPPGSGGLPQMGFLSVPVLVTVQVCAFVVLGGERSRSVTEGSR
jgi:hypothetical protein